MGHSPGPILLVAAPADISPTAANVVAGQALEVFIIIAKHTSATTIREFCKNEIYYSWVLEGTPRAQGFTVRSQVERERKQTWDTDLIGMEGGAPRVSQVHYLKHKSQN